MNVLQIIDNAIYGGAERHTLFISVEFLRHGHTLTLVCPEGPFLKEYRRIESLGGRVIVVPEISRHYFNPLKLFHRRRFYVARRKLLEVVTNEHFHLIHSHMHCADYLVASIAKYVPHTVKITTLHNLEAFDHHPVYRYIRKPFIVNALREFDFAFTISETTVEVARDYFALPGQKVRVLKNAIDPEFLKPNKPSSEVRSRLNIKPGTFTFLCLGEYCERKNQITILRAVKELSEMGVDNFVVVLAGLDKSGYGERVLRRAVKDLNLEDKVIIPGFFDDPASLLNACNAYLQPSLWDPLPRSLLEAMYFGKPCIASDIPGNRDVINHGKTGLCHPPEDFKVLARHMKELIESPEKARELGRRAREVILKEHLISHMYSTIVETVKPLIRNNF